MGHIDLLVGGSASTLLLEGGLHFFLQTPAVSMTALTAHIKMKGRSVFSAVPDFGLNIANG